MNSIRRNLVGLSMILGVILLADAPSPAQADSSGPYYATPSWDQTLPAATRFIILSNFASAAVLDRNTGLVWEKSPATTPGSWFTARTTCVNKVVGGQKGWRLPSLPELASLVDPSVAPPGPTLPPGHPFLNVQSFGYYSATTDAEVPSRMWDVFFQNGLVDPNVKEGNSFFTWCVRGPMQESVY